MGGAHRYGIRGDELLAFAHLEHICFDVDLDGNISGRARTFARSWSLRFGLIFHFVSCLRTDFAAGLDVFHRREIKWLDIRHHELVTGLHCFQFAGIESLKEMNVTVKLLGDGFSGVAVGQKL
ncbi:MAG: hypothetical protein DME76_11905 [Verrucomicrobia bacterium]|nr:MAG: hypothetical protein DME76_11905 [Verrucomicrobiota bacterium]